MYTASESEHYKVMGECPVCGQVFEARPFPLDDRSGEPYGYCNCLKHGKFRAGFRTIPQKEVTRPDW